MSLPLRVVRVRTLAGFTRTCVQGLTTTEAKLAVSLLRYTAEIPVDTVSCEAYLAPSLSFSLSFAVYALVLCIAWPDLSGTACDAFLLACACADLL